jgi:phosphoserine phosphatase RsbU/P
MYSAVHERLAAALRAAWLFRSVLEETTRRERAERDRLEREMEIATRIQTGILPRTNDVEGLELAATMVPATEVGGDYFDVLPFSGGCWFGIGDVAGHGLPTGLVMLMIQSIVSATTQCRADAAPADVWRTVNSVLYQNVRERLEQNEHATLTLLRYQTDGRIAFAGAHEDLIVYRAESGRSEIVPTPGIWAGIVRESRGDVPQGETRLCAGDILLLHTDGLTEARDEGGEVFGLARLCRRLEELASMPVERIRDGILDAVRDWCAVRDDDLTLVVIKRLGV